MTPTLTLRNKQAALAGLDQSGQAVLYNFKKDIFMPMTKPKYTESVWQQTTTPTHYIHLYPDEEQQPDQIHIQQGLNYVIFDLDIGGEYSFAISPLVMAGTLPPPANLTVQHTTLDRFVLQVVNFNRTDHGEPYKFTIHTIKKSEPSTLVPVAPEVIFEPDPDPDGKPPLWCNKTKAKLRGQN